MPQFVVSYVDQFGQIRSCHVPEAKDWKDAVAKGQDRLLEAARSLEPAFYSKALNLTMLNWEQGSVTAEGWVRDRDAEQRPR